MKSRKPIPIHILIAIAAIVLPYSLASQQTSAFSLFASDSVVHVRLVTDMKQLVKDKMDEEYQPATLILYGAEGDSTVLEVEVRSRGNVRKEVCYYPPIRVKLPKDQFSHHKLKWVMVCRDSEFFEQALMKELMAYRMFAALTENSFQTALVRVEYVDTGRDNTTFTRHAFVMEHEDALAGRLGGRVYEPLVLKEKLLNREQLALFTLFEYMIANTDWAFANRHNIEIIADRVTNSLLVLPYDFDYSGLIGAPYAVPHNSMPIDDVRERYNKSICLTEDEALNAMALFIARRAAMEEACKSVPGAGDRTIRDVLGFVDDFYKAFKRDRSVISVFVNNCQPLDD